MLGGLLDPLMAKTVARISDAIQGCFLGATIGRLREQGMHRHLDPGRARARVARQNPRASITFSGTYAPHTLAILRSAHKATWTNFWQNPAVIELAGQYPIDIVLYCLCYSA
jgi:hypothetical protein